MMNDDEDKDLGALLRAQATRHAAPRTLQASVRTQLALQAARDAGHAGTRVSWWRRLAPVGWPAAAGGFAAGVLCTALALPLAHTAWQSWGLQPQLVAHHVRALQTGALVDVASSDRHTVKPWFQGRIDYAPPVFDLAAEGFPLGGGRIEHLRGEAVATLAYYSDRHVIDLYVWPDDGTTSEPHAAGERGFNLVRWSDGAMQYAAVSDVELHRLQRFAGLWRERRAEPQAVER
jgi:anti-sigma factor RsiW